mgnify:CR=1 FL=1
MRQKIRNMNIRKKLVFYSYLIITPILLLISSIMFVRNYRKNVKEEQEQYLKSVENLSEGIDTMLNGLSELGTYICINQDILDMKAAFEQDFNFGGEYTGTFSEFITWIPSYGSMRHRCVPLRI